MRFRERVLTMMANRGRRWTAVGYGAIAIAGALAVAMILMVPFPWELTQPTLEIPVFAQGYSNTNPYAYFVPPGACNSTVSGNSTGTQGLTTSGASTTPVVAAQVSVTGTNTLTFICNISPPNAIITANNGIAISDAVFFYGNSGSGNLGVQTSVAASGTLNGAIVFSSITYPTAAASETPSTITPVRADAGTLGLVPAVTSFNVTTSTAGGFFSEKFTPATAIAWKTDLKQLLLTVTFQGAATTPTALQTPGVLVHFRGQ